VVILSNEVWRETVAQIPYDRRLLLLPQCLRDQEKCTAEIDDLGLVCRHCGLCPIHYLQSEADRLGYVVMVAEGSPVVMSLIETGAVDAIVGVSCLNVLERVFPYMEAGAVPGLAIPLLQDGCADTSVDLDWVWDAIYLTSEDKTRRLSLDALRDEVDSWFNADALDDIMNPSSGKTEDLGRRWLAKSGKRWRPFLTVCAFEALRQDVEGPLPTGLRKVAVAVECFHKASLIHDDIEDADASRYGEKSLHEEHGIAIALNVGDFLLGEGYRLIADCDATDAQKARMLGVAAEGHRDLCIGQGEELLWMRTPAPLSTKQVLDIFQKKTAPAFEVALRMGAIYAGADEDIGGVISRYSESLGIAYQINDDFNDFGGSDGPADLQAVRPNVFLSLAHERARGEARELIEAVWRGTRHQHHEKVAEIVRDLEIYIAVQQLFESYKQEAIRSLNAVAGANLKGLLRRVVGKIFDDLEIMFCCDDYKAGNAGGGTAGTGSPR